MEQKPNTIDLEYVDARKASSKYIKFFAFLLVFIILFVPMYEFIPALEPQINYCGFSCLGPIVCY